MAKILERPSFIALAVGFVVGLAGPWLTLRFIEDLPRSIEPGSVIVLIWLAAAICIASLVGGSAIAAFLPSFLLGSRDRAASATHAWIGAREVRRHLGSAAAAIKIPTTPDEAVAWLVRIPDTPQLGPLRFELLLLARRFDEARLCLREFPLETPLDEYRAAEAAAVVDDQETGQSDISSAKDALARIPRGIDRVEATASLAVFEARRLVGRGDWRGPLVDARPHIPGSDWSILARDLELPIFRAIVPKIVLPVAGFIVVIATLVTVSSLG
jgi:hypothetical protein